jgi:hypothetical protein
MADRNSRTLPGNGILGGVTLSTGTLDPDDPNAEYESPWTQANSPGVGEPVRWKSRQVGLPGTVSVAATAIRQHIRFWYRMGALCFGRRTCSAANGLAILFAIRRFNQHGANAERTRLCRKIRAAAAPGRAFRRRSSDDAKRRVAKPLHARPIVLRH